MTKALFLRAACFFLAVGITTPTVLAQTPAFPGAEGFGRYATGGRGGSVYYVTNLNDSGAGSFRDAVSQPNRTVVFAVSGVIDYQSPRYNIARNVTIAGQTAPGDGVVLYGDGIGFTGSHNTITRFIRFRMGHDAVGEDTVGIASGHDMIFDHLSATWSLDEVFSVSGSTEDPTNITIQASIIGQGLQDHSAGGLIQTDGGVSILRSLYIDNGTRNPKVKGVNEFVNNVVYNWEVDAYILGDSAGQSYANVIGNYFINGPGSGNDDAFSRGNLNFHLFATNNWQDKDRDGVLDGVLLTQSDYDVNDWQTAPFAYPIAVSNALPVLTAVKLVVSDVGPAWRRDTVDQRLVTELTSWGTLGETIFTEFDPPMNGPGPFKSGVVPLDTDKDGMPDYWEAGLGMATNAANNNDASAGGYTKLEDYLNWLADPHGVALTNTTVDIDLRQFTRGFVKTSPAYAVTNAANGTVTLLNGHVARFVPTAGFIGQAGFQFTVLDSQGSTITRPMGLFFTPQPPAFARVWRGDDATNNWDVLGTCNWFDEQSLLYPFHNGDAVGFDDTGSTNPAVQLVGSVQPALVAVNATKNYTFSGSGSLDGTMALTKAGSGTLTLANTNSYSGATTVSNGSLLVHGSLVQSVVTVQSGALLGGDGRLGVAPALASGATLAPDNGIGSAGTLTISNALTESGGVINRFDLSDDPTGLVKTNDRISVIGNLNLSGVNSIQVNLLNGPLANGVYTLITYSGTLSGGLGNLTLSGANGALTNPPGAIGIVVNNTRAPASLVWAGDGVNNIWDSGTNANWINGALPDWFYFGDTVRFDDAGSTNPAIAISGTVRPAAVTVAATKDYTFGGAGKISGTTGLTKSNPGTLTVLTTNDYTGATTVSGGVLSVEQLPNGGVAGSIGAAATNPANLVLGGGVLRYTGGSGSTDRGATFNLGGGTINVVSGVAVLTWNGVLTGAGTLTKTGAGRLDVNAISDYSGGTVVTEGAVRLINVAGLGSGTLTLNGNSNGATLRFGADAQTLGNALNIVGTNNYSVNSGNDTVTTLTGSGTLYLDGSSGNTFTLEGNMSGFSGTLAARTLPILRFNPSTGSSNATFDLGTGSCKLNNRNGGTFYVGALIGGSSTILEGASSMNNPTTYIIGGKNIDTVFAGTIRHVSTAAPLRLVNLVKEGSGTFTLTGSTTNLGTTTVNDGTLLINNSTGLGLGTNTITVNSGGTLGGTGRVGGAVTVNANGALAPGGAGIVGMLTISNSLALNGSAILRFDVGSSCDRLAVSNNLVLGGTLNVNALAGFGAGTNIIFTYGGALSGSLAIGSKPAGYTCTVLTNTAGQVRLAVVAQVSTPPIFGSISALPNGLAFSGSNGVADGTYYVLASTNVALPSSNWIRVATNQFNVSGTFSFTNAIDLGQPRQFYQLQLP